MSTCQEIIDWVNRKFPNHGETDANLLKDLNDIHKEVFTKISHIKNKQEIWSFQTVNDPPLPSYDLPDDCTIDLIVSVTVSKTVNPATVDDYDTYEYAGINDYVSSGYYYYDGGFNPDLGVYKIGLIANGDIIQTAGLEVRVYYNERPNILTALTDVPNLNSDYHTLLKYALIASTASQGNNPDTDIADFYQRKFDEFLRDIQDDISERYNTNPNQSNQCKVWW